MAKLNDSRVPAALQRNAPDVMAQRGKHGGVAPPKAGHRELGVLTLPGLICWISAAGFDSLKP